MSEQGNKGGIACLLKFHILWQAQTDEGKIKGAGGHLRALIPPILYKKEESLVRIFKKLHTF